MNLTPDRAAAAVRAYEEFVDDAALRGKAEKNFSGNSVFFNLTTGVLFKSTAAARLLHDSDGPSNATEKHRSTSEIREPPPRK